MFIDTKHGVNHMRLYKTRVTKRNLTLMVVAAVCSWAAMVSACPVIRYTLAEKTSMTSDIFIIQVDQIDVVEPADKANESFGLRRGKFKVVEVLKGSAPALDVIESFDKSFSPYCNSVLTDNTRYLVLGNPSGKLFHTGCGNIMAESKAHETIEAIKTSLLIHKPTEMFTGIYVRDQQRFLNDDGTTTKAIDLWPTEYYAEMTRVFIEAVRMPSGRLLVISLFDEQTLSQEEIAVVKEQAGMIDTQIFASVD